jgi:hypothetical protein
MTEASSANVELAIVLPLGVVANQLLRIEADLRSLHMKAWAYAKEREHGGLDPTIEMRLDEINEALDLIRGLTKDMAADLRPSRPSRTDD